MYVSSYGITLYLFRDRRISNREEIFNMFRICWNDVNTISKKYIAWRLISWRWGKLRWDSVTAWSGKRFQWNVTRGGYFESYVRRMSRSRSFHLILARSIGTTSSRTSGCRDARETRRWQHGNKLFISHEHSCVYQMMRWHSKSSQ
jgi:hypothetical protein